MSEPRPISFDAPLGQRIIELHVWAVRQGLLGTAAAELFDGFCQRLVLGGLPLWRASAAMRTLHPQWGGYSYLWRRDLNAIERDLLDGKMSIAAAQASYAVIVDPVTLRIDREATARRRSE